MSIYNNTLLSLLPLLPQNLSSRWTPISQIETYSQTSLFMITYVHLHVNQIRLFISKSRVLVVLSKQLHV